jgi:CheY-like chemotaxis protein
VPRVLVADDNSNIQKTATLALKDAGIDVVSVANGEAAVRKLPDLLPDLILADIFMPVRSGYEVCEYVKHDSRFSHIPVILLVGAFDPFDEKEARRVSADGVLKKPFVPPDPLINMVTTLLAKSASENGGEEAAPAASGTGSPRLAGEPPRARASRRESPSASAAISEAPAATLTEVPPLSDLTPGPALIPSTRRSDSGSFAESLEAEAEPVSTPARDPILGEPVWNHAAISGSGETPLEEITEEHSWGVEPAQEPPPAVPPALDLYPGSPDIGVLTLTQNESDHDFGAVPGFELTALETASAEPSTLEIGAHDRPAAVDEDPPDPLALSDTRIPAERMPPVEASAVAESLPGEQEFAPAPVDSEAQAPLPASVEVEAVAPDTRVQSEQPAEEESFGWPLLVKEIGADEAPAELSAEASPTQLRVAPLDNPERDPYRAAEPPLAFPAGHQYGEFLQIALADAADLLANNSRGLEHATLEPDLPLAGNFITAEPASEYVPVTEAIPGIKWETEPKSTTVTTVPESEALSSTEFPSAGHPVLADIAPTPSIGEAHDLPNSTVTTVPEAESFSSEEFPRTGYPALAEIAAAPSTSEAHNPANSTEGSWLDFHEPLDQARALDAPESLALAAANPIEEPSELPAAPPNSVSNMIEEEPVTSADTSEVAPTADVLATAGTTSPSEPLSAAAVDAIVTRVVDRVQLSITEVLTRELLRPIVEALVRSELDNH